jgi:large subunit ribosomal protein L10
MSKYVKELMMDQLRTDLGDNKSLLILDLKDLDAQGEYQLRRDLRKKSIHLRVLKNTLARRVFADLGMDGLSQFLVGASAAAWGGEGIAELAKEISKQVKALKKPEIKGGAVDGVVVGPGQVEDITKLPSREVLIGQVLTLLLGPAREALALVSSPASTLIGQLEAFIEKHQGPGDASDPPSADAAGEPPPADAAGEPPPADAAGEPPPADAAGEPA